jgi:hypothetical protein
MNDLKQAAITAVVLALPAILTALTALLVAALRAAQKKLEAEAGASKLAQVADRATMLAETIVRELEATLRPQLAKDAEDGQLTDEEAQQLKAEAMKQLRASLGEHGLAELEATLKLAGGSIGNFLAGLIEKVVSGMKLEQAQGAALVRNVTAAAVGPTVPTVPAPAK